MTQRIAYIGIQSATQPKNINIFFHFFSVLLCQIKLYTVKGVFRVREALTHQSRPAEKRWLFVYRKQIYQLPLCGFFCSVKVKEKSRLKKLDSFTLSYNGPVPFHLHSPRMDIVHHFGWSTECSRSTNGWEPLARVIKKSLLISLLEPNAKRRWCNARTHSVATCTS